MPTEHLARKTSDYWTDLDGGDTSVHKADTIRHLAASVSMPKVDTILDIGCGTSHLSTELAMEWGARGLIRVDYDPQTATQSGGETSGITHQFRLGDVYSLPEHTAADVILFLDVLHEVYSFGGRNRCHQGYADRRQAISRVKRYIEHSVRYLRPKGTIIITDDLLCQQVNRILLRTRRKDVSDAIRCFLSDYRGKTISAYWIDGHGLSITARDFCTLLTQYNKILRQDWDRWEVERMEVHQYMTISQYHTTFASLGLQCWHIADTPASALREWEDDFDIISGACGFPHKRIAILARLP